MSSDRIQVFNFLTFDLEEWFHILNLPISDGSRNWDTLPSRVEAGLERFLDLLSRYNTSCTFLSLDG